MNNQPKKPLPPVAATSAVGVLLTAFVMAGVPAAILTYQDFASGNHDAPSLLAIFGLALLSAISATGAITVHNKSNAPANVQNAIENTVVPTLANMIPALNAILSHVAQPPAQAPIHINNIMPGAASPAPVQQPYTPPVQPPVQFQAPALSSMQSVPPLSAAPAYYAGFYTDAAKAGITQPPPSITAAPAPQQAADASSAAVPPVIDSRWNDSRLIQAIPPIASKPAQ